jgi:pimeloyl-ACP methyl ester carboxylesterase
VPLDRSGAVPGTLSLRVARAGAAKRGNKVLFALAGGPGQPGAFFAPFSREDLGRAVEGYTVYGLDQRGTGASGVIKCSRLQASVGTSDFAVPAPGSVETCGESLGARRGLYSTSASVQDLEALRRAIGAPKVAFIGVSYGTYVAERYSRAHPTRVERLVLDSVVPQENVDPLARSNLAQVRTNLETACARGRCRGITSDPVGDMATLVSRLPLRGSLYDDRGRRRAASIPDGPDLLDGIVTTTFSEELDRRIPAAVRSALDGDPAPLLRLRRVTRMMNAGPASSLSAGLHAATLCADIRYPWGGPDAPLAGRRPALDAAAAAVPEADLRPFDRVTSAGNGIAVECERWPVTPGVTPPPAPGPLPDVPILIINGGRDTSTPTADARVELARAPRGELLVVRGSGHSVTTKDLPCVSKALRLFFDGQRVGDPCRKENVREEPRAVDPRRLADETGIQGVGGTLGKAMAASFDTVDDAALMIFQVLTGPTARMGGLRGGVVTATFRRDALKLTYDGVVYVPGVRVSGSLSVDRRLFGTLRVSGVVSGRIVLRRNGDATSTLGGRRIELTSGRSVLAPRQLREVRAR